MTYGQGDRPPRGDYGRARADYTCDQDWAALHRGRSRHLPPALRAPGGSSCRVSPATSSSTRCSSSASPTASRASTQLSERLLKATGWEVVARAGADPGGSLLHAAGRTRFPVTDWIRKPEEFDYVVEPDVFHDLFGHVPLLFNPMFADYMQAYGAGGLKASRLDACELLARLYWYTVEFGLIDTPEGLRAYGAGILSFGRRAALQRAPARSRSASPSTCSA